MNAVLSDLSLEGCRISMEAPGFVQPGSTIVVQIADDVEVACQVVWLDSGYVGLRFYEALDAKILAGALGEREPDILSIHTNGTANARLII